MDQSVYLQYANSSSNFQSMLPYWSKLQITMSILLKQLKCKGNKMNEMKYNSKSLINKLINIENIKISPGWLVNIALASLWQA